MACSNSHSISHQDLQTKFRASISLTTETEDFLSHLDGHIYSPPFIQGHLDFLQKQGSDIESELANTSAANADATSLDSLKQATAELTHTLNQLQSLPPNAPAQRSFIRHLDSIRQRLEADMPR